MSTLLEQASLVMIPSGYKEDVVYSQIPTSGAGDLSFTRASNGTRINSAGLVEVCPWNLVGYSEEFNNAIWQKNNNVSSAPVVTANDTTAPNGTMTADKIVFSNGVGGAINGVYQYFTTLKGARTASVWLKSASGTPTIYITTQDDAAGGNFTTCVLSTEWKRFEVTFTTNSTSLQSLLIGYYPASGTPSGPSGSLTVYAWGGMVNIGSTAKPYFPTTDRLNVPRLTYQNGGGGCPSLLLEKQSTNVFTYSEQFDDASWVKFNSSISANTTTSPDGTSNADSLIENTGNTDHGFYKFAPTITTASGAVTISCFIKSNGRRVQIKNSYTTDASNFDLQNGVVVSNVGSGVGEIQNIGNGWYRCILKTTANASGNAGLTLSLLDNSNNMVYTGNGTSGVFLWGAQIEVSSYPTSYIPTTSSSATRVADACSKTGISSLIGQTEGTVFVDYFYLNNSTDDITIGIDGNNGKFMWFRKNGVQFYGNSSALLFSATSTQVQGSRYKIAFVYGQSDFRLYVNGSAVANATTGTFTGTFDDFRFFPVGGAPFVNSNKFNQITLFPNKLTNAELASLTTL